MPLPFRLSSEPFRRAAHPRHTAPEIRTVSVVGFGVCANAPVFVHMIAAVNNIARFIKICLLRR